MNFPTSTPMLPTIECPPPPPHLIYVFFLAIYQCLRVFQDVVVKFWHVCNLRLPFHYLPFSLASMFVCPFVTCQNILASMFVCRFVSEFVLAHQTRLHTVWTVSRLLLKDLVFDCTQIAKTVASTSIMHRTDTFASDRYLILIDPICYLGTDGVIQVTYSHRSQSWTQHWFR